MDKPSVRPIVPAALATLNVYRAFKRVQDAEDALDKALARVPSYTGQYEPEDFITEEQEEFNRAVDDLHTELHRWR